MNRVVFAIIAGLGSTVAIGALCLTTHLGSDIVLLMAPFGSSAVILFGLPNSRYANARNVIAGHCMTALIGVCFVEYLGVSSLTLSIATGLAVTSMLITRLVHPPAGANPLLIMLTEQSWDFLFTTVLLGTIILVSLAKGMWALKNHYRPEQIDDGSSDHSEVVKAVVKKTTQ